MTTRAACEHDLAISAVVYDTMLVGELMAIFASRLRAAPVWTGAPVIASTTEASPLDDDVSRVALVLVQRLWGRDAITAVDADVLRDRVRRKPDSIVAVSLDGDPLQPWMVQVRRCDLATLGVDGVAAFVLEVIAGAGGLLKAPPKITPSIESESVARWPNPPTPYLGQTRAQSSLRRELDLLVTELERRVDSDEGTDRILEVHVLPNRTVARVDEAGVSFSWVPARSGSVADGRLMVIEWSGIAGGTGRGAPALKTAHAVRECVYVAEAADADHWCWRADGPHGRASSTAHLVAEWIAAVSMTTRQLAGPSTSN